MQSHLKRKAPRHGEQETSINEPPRSKLLRVRLEVMPTQSPCSPETSPPSPLMQGCREELNLSHRASVDLSIVSFRASLGNSIWSSGKCSERQEGFLLLAAGRRYHSSAPALPLHGCPMRSAKLTASCSELPFLALWFLSLWLLAYSFLQTDGREHTPCYHTKQNPRSRRNVAEADTLSSQAKQLNR